MGGAAGGPDRSGVGSFALLRLEDQALLAQCEVDCYRASGPGGQHRNKTSSAVRLRHLPTGLSALANEDRSQHVNKARALRRLRRTIALDIREAVDRERYRPSETVAGCISGRQQLSVGRRDERFPLVVAEVLDVLAACALRISDAADALGISTANLVKFLAQDLQVWKHINDDRQRAGLKPLRPPGK